MHNPGSDAPWGKTAIVITAVGCPLVLVLACRMGESGHGCWYECAKRDLRVVQVLDLYLRL